MKVIAKRNQDGQYFFYIKKQERFEMFGNFRLPPYLEVEIREVEYDILEFKEVEE